MIKIDDKDIFLAIKVIIQNVDLDDKAMLSVFEDHGLPSNVANYLILFVPLAFSRIMCAKLNVQLPDEYVIRYKNGKMERGALSSNEIFLKIQQTSAFVIKSGMDSESILAISSRSHEFKLINDALLKGFELNKVKFSPIQFLMESGA